MIEVQVRSSEETKELLKDPTYLPTAAEVKIAFPKSEEKYPGVNEKWRNFLNETHTYQLLTKEMVEDLATQIISIVNKLLQGAHGEKQPITILELGAGDGRLAHFLGEELAKRSIDLAIKIVPTDDMSWKKQGKITQTEFPVEDLPAHEAVAKYASDGPTILLSSWMPPNENWVANYLPMPTIEGVILIGDRYAIGTGPDTWEPDGEFTTNDFTQSIRSEGNLGKGQDSPNSPHGQSDFALVTKAK